MAIRAASDMYDGSSALQSGVANTEVHGTAATGQFGGGIEVGTQLKLLLPIGVRGEFGNFYTLENPSLGVPLHALRTA